MRAAQLDTWGGIPQYTTVADLPPSDASSGLVQIKVEASALHQLVRSRTTGKHFSATTLPHIPGVDGTGTDPDGNQVYFSSMSVGGASFAEYVNVEKHHVFPLPNGLDPVKAAALANPAMSSWMALKHRTFNLPKDFTVLIVGATSTSGKIAISVARILGAGKVYGVARDQSKLTNLGLDKTFTLGEYGDLNDVDVILDYVYGDATVPLFEALPSNKTIQYVHIGALSGSVIAPLSASILRSKDISIRGAGPGSWDPRKLKHEVSGFLEAVKATDIEAYETHKLSEIEVLWSQAAKSRLVFVP